MNDFSVTGFACFLYNAKEQRNGNMPFMPNYAKFNWHKSIKGNPFGLPLESIVYIIIKSIFMPKSDLFFMSFQEGTYIIFYLQQVYAIRFVYHVTNKIGIRFLFGHHL